MLDESTTCKILHHKCFNILHHLYIFNQVRPNGFSLIFNYLIFIFFRKYITVFFQGFSTDQSSSNQQSHSEFRLIQCDEMMTVLQARLSGSYLGRSKSVHAKQGIRTELLSSKVAFV